MPASAGGGYSFGWLRFPRCLRRYRGCHLLLHVVWHMLGSDRALALAAKLCDAGFLYAANAEGATYSWQWRFWRGSPAQRQLQAVGSGMPVEEARLIT